MRTQTNKRRNYPDKLKKLDKKTKDRLKKPKRIIVDRSNKSFTLSCSDSEWRTILSNTKKIREFKLKRSEILRKVLLNLTDEELLYHLGYNLRKLKKQ